MEIQIDHISRHYGAVRALDDVSLTIGDGELFFLLGPSGCGKTTLLRCIGGFETPTSGAIRIGGVDVCGRPANERDTAMVFQGYALWPHMTVRENVSFGLEMKGLKQSEIAQRVERVLKEIQISELAERKPNQLSGGQQQRVALARTLVVHPGCLLLDEPLANLDAKLRRDMRHEIRRICKDNGLTSIYVTHDRAEALSMADRIAVFNSGKIVQCGAPREVYRRPVNAFVASFLGDTNLFQGEIEAIHSDGTAEVSSQIGKLISAAVPKDMTKGTKVTLSMRPEAFRRTAAVDGGINHIQVEVKREAYLGELADRTGVVDGGHELNFYEINPVGLEEPGNRLTLEIAPDDVVCLPRE